jgi:hypothetical protein
MNRRQFFGSVAVSAVALKVMAQETPGDVPNWGGPVLDIHLHAKGPDGEWAHMQGCGVSHAQLLTSVTAEAHVKEEMAKHDGRLKYSASIDPARADALDLLRNAIKGGATGLGEMKSRSKADSAEMKRSRYISPIMDSSKATPPTTKALHDSPQYSRHIRERRSSVTLTLSGPISVRTCRRRRIQRDRSSPAASQTNCSAIIRIYTPTCRRTPAGMLWPAIRASFANF